MQGIIVLAIVCLGYANGANDNFKGVATLFGSGTSDYRRALAWATITTLLGSLTAPFLAAQLLTNFTGRGLVDDNLMARTDYAAAVALGAALTVVMATWTGMPISTTHTVVGALVGAGVAAASAINLTRLAGTFLVPLLVTPILALAITGTVYPVLHFARRRLGIRAETCLCVGNEVLETVPAGDHAAALERAQHLSLRIGDTVTCQERYQGRLIGVEAGMALDWFHYVSAGAVSFARGLNDTPKIAALLLLAPQLGGSTAIVGVAIALGGAFSARRVAETMGRKITIMNHGQGFTANLMTAIIVIAASPLGLPVSTTYVSCGALFGVGAVTRRANWRTIARILGAWATTLPLAAILGAVAFSIIEWL